MIKFKEIKVDLGEADFKAKGDNIMVALPIMILEKFRDHIDDAIKDKRKVITLAKKSKAVKKPAKKAKK